MPEFKVGDRVRVNHHARRGWIGVVCQVDERIHWPYWVDFNFDSGTPGNRCPFDASEMELLERAAKPLCPPIGWRPDHG